MYNIIYDIIHDIISFNMISIYSSDIIPDIVYDIMTVLSHYKSLANFHI
jgi:hypothetical protein